MPCETPANPPAPLPPTPTHPHPAHFFYTSLPPLPPPRPCFVPARLWANASAGGDHYVTQLDPNGTVRDFIDYDANLIACATGVATTDRCTALLKRVDSGRCTHAKATFVSEVRRRGESRHVAGRLFP